MLQRQLTVTTLLHFFISPAIATHRDIALVTTDLNLISFRDNLATRINSSINDRFSAAVARRFDFIYCIRNLEETP